MVFACLTDSRRLCMCMYVSAWPLDRCHCRRPHVPTCNRGPAALNALCLYVPYCCLLVHAHAPAHEPMLCSCSPCLPLLQTGFRACVPCSWLPTPVVANVLCRARRGPCMHAQASYAADAHQLQSQRSHTLGLVLCLGPAYMALHTPVACVRSCHPPQALAHHCAFAAWPASTMRICLPAALACPRAQLSACACPQAHI